MSVRIIQGLMRSLSLSDEELYDLIIFDLENGMTKFDLADIYGDGEEKESLNVQRLALNLKNVVIHPSTTEIYDEYIQSDFLVCSSRWESFGLIIIEAMSSGIPVVSFDCDNGPRNIITDAEDGLLAKNGSIEDLAAKMIQMIEQPSRRQQMGTKALRNVERFKEDVVFKEYLELYRQYV